MSKDFDRMFECIMEERRLDGIIVCPYCGHEDGEPWEYGLDDDESTTVECGSCEREFKVTCSIDVTYECEVIK